MGTRSLTRVFDDDKLVLAMYRQMDGYPEGMGADLAKFVVSGTFVTGISLTKQKPQPQFNGMGCFAAQLVKHLKEGAGGIYLVSADAEDQEYTYEIHGGLDEKSAPKPIRMVCKGSDGEVLFDGNPKKFATFCKVKRVTDAMTE